MIEIGTINAVQLVPLTWLKIYRLLFDSYNTICELWRVAFPNTFVFDLWRNVDIQGSRLVEMIRI